MININDFSHFRSAPNVQFKTERVAGEEITTISYMISDSKFWKQPLALETRGISFNSRGEVVARPFEKFFSWQEIPENFQIEDQIVHIFEKRDGSMITPVLINAQVWCKTKKSFFSDVAKEATNALSAEEAIDIVALLKERITPIFEFTSPTNEVVVAYGAVPKFTLLAARHMDTGAYVDWEELVERCPRLTLIPRVDLEFKALVSELDTRKNFEGYVAVLKDGRRVKFKTKWYWLNHRIKTEMRTRDIAGLVINNEFDELVSRCSSENYPLKPLLDIEQQVLSELRGIVRETTLIANQYLGAHPRDFTGKIKSHPYFSLIMAEIKGKTPAYEEY